MKILVSCIFIFLTANVISVDPEPSQDVSIVKVPEINSSVSLDKNATPSANSNVTLSTPLEVKNLTTETPKTSTPSTTTTTTTTAPLISAVEAEKGSSLSIFFVLCVIALGILLIHLMLQTHFQYLPESIVTVCLGACIGGFLNFTSVKSIFEREEVFSPTAFFLVLLPPIIFEVMQAPSYVNSLD